MDDPTDPFGTGDGDNQDGGGGSTTPPPESPLEVLDPPESDLNPDDEPPDDADSENVVPLRELLRMRKRAQEAEAQTKSLQERVDELEKVLVEARAAVDAVERRQQIDLALLEADTIDLESARLLTELALSQADDADVAAIVDELRERKPFLFSTRLTRTGSAMGREPRQAANSLANAARDAARTGDRRALLRYLQIRRGA